MNFLKKNWVDLSLLIIFAFGFVFVAIMMSSASDPESERPFIGRGMVLGMFVFFAGMMSVTSARLTGQKKIAKYIMLVTAFMATVFLFMYVIYQNNDWNATIERANDGRIRLTDGIAQITQGITQAELGGAPQSVIDGLVAQRAALEYELARIRPDELILSGKRYDILYSVSLLITVGFAPLIISIKNLCGKKSKESESNEQSNNKSESTAP